MGAEFLEFDLGFEAVLGFHYHIYQFIPVIMPFLDATKVTGAAFVVDDKGHHIVVQAFLEHQQSAHTAIAILKGEYLLKTDTEV